MVRIIAVASGKGGVGKTTTVANLSAVLAKRGYRVYSIDCNTSTPNLGLHLGMYLYPKTLQDFLEGKATIEEIVYEHPSGMKVIPADIAIRKSDVKSYNILETVYKILKKADFIILDTAAGLGKETLATIQAADELLVVTSPELPAVIDAAKLVEMAKRNETRVLGIVLNRVEGKKHELKDEEVEAIVGSKIIVKVPEDKHVKHAISKKTPVVHHRPKSKSSRVFERLADFVSGEERVKKGLLRFLGFWR